MSPFRQLIEEIHRRSLWQLLAIYLLGAWIGYEVVQGLTEGLGLPSWFPGFAVVLFVVGLPIVLATAFVQHGIAGKTRADPTLLPRADAGTGAFGARGAPRPATGAQRFFTWRNAIGGGVLAFALWGVVALVWLISAEGPPREVVADEGRRKMLVVLPFENLGPPDDAYFAEGTTDAITARLAAIHGLGVISRTSAIQYRGTEKKLRQIGEELNADYVLEGTIQRERPGDPSSRVRIIPQLIRVADDTHVWSATYDEDLREMFSVQSDIAERVARALDVTVLEPERESLTSRPTENLEAYDYYLRGRDYLAGKAGAAGSAGLFRAVELLQRATALDPNFALAYAELSDAHRRLFTSFADPSQERLELAKAAVDRALDIEPNLPEAHLALGLYYYSGPNPDPRRALEAFETVALRRPNSALARSLIAAVQAARGDWEQALQNIALAADLDPRSAEPAIPAGLFHLLTRRYARAERYIDRAIDLAPDQPEAYTDKIGLYLLWEGDKRKAGAAAREMIVRVSRPHAAMALASYGGALIPDGEYDRVFEGLTPDSFNGSRSFDYFFLKAEFYRLRNQPGRARAYHDSLLAALETLPQQMAADPVVNLYRGLALAGLGRNEEAIRYAERAGVVLSELARPEYARLQGTLISVYALAGQYEAALSQIDSLLANPSAISTAYLRVAPLPRGLREHPGFKRIPGVGPAEARKPVVAAREGAARESEPTERDDYAVARDAAMTARVAAVAAGADVLGLETFRSGESRAQVAVARADAGRYREAEREMKQARSAYDEARRAAGVAWRARLDSAGQEVGALRSAANPAAPGYAEAEELSQQAARAERAGEVREAFERMSEAARLYRRAADASAARAAVTETVTAGALSNVREVAEAALDEVRRAIEAEDVDALRRVWPGLSGTQIRNFETSFRLMRDLKVTFEVRSLDESGDRITVSVRTTYDYFNESSRREETQSFRQVLQLGQRDGRWVVVESLE